MKGYQVITGNNEIPLSSRDFIVYLRNKSN